MKISKEKKLLSAVCILPVLADFIEDSGLRFEAKQKANEMINHIRKFDHFFMDKTNEEIVTQQDMVQKAFRQWVNENFN